MASFAVSIPAQNRDPISKTMRSSSYFSIHQVPRLLLERTLRSARRGQGPLASQSLELSCIKVMMVVTIQRMCCEDRTIAFDRRQTPLSDGFHP